MKTILPILILTASLADAGTIVCPPTASANVKLAAKEIRRYVYLRTGALLSVVETGQGIALKVDPALGAQEYWIKPDGITGGSDVGVLYGAYRYAELLGVRFQIDGDVIPDERLEGLPEVKEETGKPLFELRGLQPFHDFPEGPDWWTQDDWFSVVNQAVKMRMNFIGLHTYPFHNKDLGPEPTVWVGLPEDVNADGTVKTADHASWYTTAKFMPYGCYRPMKTGDYSFGGAEVFPSDNYAPELNAPDDFPMPKTPEAKVALINRTGAMLKTIFDEAHRRGLKIAVGTESPLDIPDAVAARLKELGMRPDDPATLQKLYAGMFTRIQRAYPIDYYWIWGHEGEIDQKRFVANMQAAHAALRETKAPFGLGICGWGWITANFPSLDQALSKDVVFSAISMSTGHAPVSENFARLGDAKLYSKSPTKSIPLTFMKPMTLTERPYWTWNETGRLLTTTLFALVVIATARAADDGATAAEANLALVATSATSYVSGHETIAALNDGATPVNSNDKRHGAYGNWPQRGTQWVQYDWTQPISTRRMDVYWFDDHGGVRLPKACRLKYWNGSAYVEVPDATGLGLAESRFNITTFPELTTTKLRLEFDGGGDASTGLLEWRVYDSGKSPNFPPAVSAGVDRAVVLPGKTYLSGKVKDDGKPRLSPMVRWSQESGPGKVIFADASAVETSAGFSKVGSYVLKLTADDGHSSASGKLQVTAVATPAAPPLSPVWTTPYQVSSPFWRPRLKNLIVNWIPHCVQKCEDPQTKEGGIENFVQAARKLAGQPGARHKGAVFANTWVYNTLESMCIAQMLDAHGDAEIAAAQAAQRKTIDDWVPKMLAAQEPDGYLHTQYTIEGRRRWSDKHAHEDYQAGYFIETAIAHHLMTGGKDSRMLNAAKRLADCWVKNIGPAPKRSWYPGHQEMEMALVKLARYVEQTDGPGTGKPYVELAKFLLDSRKGGDEYDQSHAPVTRQYEAVGHAVRALYSYAGMADVAMETGDTDYQSAVQSLWHSIVNKKYYVTGGVGSGETSEGFGKEFSLPNNAYCESCANSGELFFQEKLQMTYRDARYADLAEETLFNAILGDVDLLAQNYTYTNPLDSSGRRYKWHVCPCCVGNIPRTLLSLPTWTYTKGKDELYVNLFAGSTVTIDNFAGISVQLVQVTDYPWNGKVALMVNPAASKKFALKIRVPNRQTSLLYTNTPTVEGLLFLAVNGKTVKPKIERGYAVLDRTWKAGDKIEWEVPLKIQRVKADNRIAADRGRVALRYGPLIYNGESVDQDLNAILSLTAPLATEWRPDLLGGVVVIKGEFVGGKPLLAIPNYARLNRGGRSIVWMKDQ